MEPPSGKGLPMQTNCSPSRLPDTSRLVSKDDTPLDFFTQSQARLLTSPLYASWSAPPLDAGGAKRSFEVFANVGVFASVHEPPVVPDVMLSLDITLTNEFMRLPNSAYFLWEFGKFPEIVIEIISEGEDDELTQKISRYRQMGIKYCAVYDPEKQRSHAALRSYELRGDVYVEIDSHVYAPIGLGLKEWHGKHERHVRTWLRWCTNDGRLIPTSEEHLEEAQKYADEAQKYADEAQKRMTDGTRGRAEDADKRADDERKRAEDADKRAAALADRLRALGIDPNAI